MFVHFRLTRLRSSESTFADYRRKYHLAKWQKNEMAWISALKLISNVLSPITFYLCMRFASQHKQYRLQNNGVTETPRKHSLNEMKDVRLTQITNAKIKRITSI